MICRIQNIWLCPLFAREYILMSFDTLQLYSLSPKQPTLIPGHPCHDCFHVHIITWRVLLSSFLGLFGCFTHFLPAFQQRLKAMCRPERGKVGSQGLTWHRGQLTLVPAVSVKRTTLPTHNVCCQEAWGSQHLLCWTLHKASVCQSLAWGFSILPYPIFHVLYMRPIAAEVTANPRTCWEGALFCLV